MTKENDSTNSEPRFSLFMSESNTDATHKSPATFTAMELTLLFTDYVYAMSGSLMDAGRSPIYLNKVMVSNRNVVTAIRWLAADAVEQLLESNSSSIRVELYRPITNSYRYYTVDRLPVGSND